MIIAHVLYKKQDIPVRVLDAWQQVDGRKVAAIVTTDGSQPFDTITHGGPAMTDSIVIRAEALRDVAIDPEGEARAIQLERLLIAEELQP